MAKMATMKTTTKIHLTTTTHLAKIPDNEAAKNGREKKKKKGD
jgi:hypothetical protein